MDTNTNYTCNIDKCYQYLEETTTRQKHHLIQFQPDKDMNIMFKIPTSH